MKTGIPLLLLLAAVAPDNPPRPAADSFSASKAGDEREVSGIKVCWCPHGRFTMGSPRTEPERRPGEDQVEVTLTKGFWMGKYEVTQGEWKRVVGKFRGEFTEGGGKGDDLPVYNVNYAEAEGFCRRLTGFAHASGELPSDWEFRLPTEAQWEYACRAGTTTATAFGDTLNRTQANVLGKPHNWAKPGPLPNHATKVGSYPANAWGLHDMHGNVVEWCRDWYHEKLPGGADPDLSSVKGARNGDGTYSRSRRGSA
jgi:sulfatase modifying factor 1